MRSSAHRFARSLATGLLVAAMRASRRSVLMTRREMEAFEGFVGGAPARSRAATPVASRRSSPLSP